MSDIVYADMNQDQLDAQYNNRAQVPEHPEHYERWAPLCQGVLDDFEHRLDVAYGASPRETVDVILPSGPGPHPVHFYIHGGYWMSRSKSDQTFLARPLVSAGAVFVLVEYDLIPDVRMDDIVRQCRSAVAHIHANAAEFNVDPGRVYVSGHSAGGHLTAMLAATDWAGFADAPADLVKGGCPLSGIFELEPIRLTYMQETLLLTETEVADNSPMRFESAPAMPLVVGAGGAETDEFRRQSQDFVADWNAKGGNCTYLECDGANHFTILDHIADANSPLALAMAAQMDL